MRSSCPRPTRPRTWSRTTAAPGSRWDAIRWRCCARAQPFAGCRSAQQLQALNSGRFVRVAGLVTGRQRPGTASGVLFLTLEDETGNINVVVWRDRQERFRKALLRGQLLLVKGVMESRDSVIHVIAGEILDHSAALGALQTRSRDFH